MKTLAPTALVGELMRTIRERFYPDAAARKWSQDYHFIKDRAILWPATWLDKKGITLRPDRYKQIILEVLDEIQAHGNTGKIGYWPAYLSKCIQERFKHRSEAIYEEGKNLRNQMETALQIAGNATAQIDPVTALAEARQDLLKAKQSRRSAALKADKADQLNLF